MLLFLKVLSLPLVTINCSLHVLLVPCTCFRPRLINYDDALYTDICVSLVPWGHPVEQKTLASREFPV